MKKLYNLLLFVLLLSVSGFSQENPRIDKKTFFSSEEGLASAKKSLSLAEKYYKKGSGTYDEALKHYLKVLKYNAESDALNYKIGVCYLWTSNKKAALAFFLKSSPSVSKDYYLGLGRAYQYNLMFDKAKENYSKYINSLKKWEQGDVTPLYNQLVDECDVSKAIIQDSVSVFIINLGPIINSYYDEYGAVLPPDNSKLFFTSKRPDVEPRKRVSRFEFRECIWTANNNAIDKPAAWIDFPEKLDFLVNTSVAGYDLNDDVIYFYKGKTHGGRLYSAQFDGEKWIHIRPIKGGVNHIAYKETSISVDANGNAYFVSDRRGGFGGKDIWMATPKNEKSFNKPINLGDVINTPFNEEGVYITSDGNTLYFSSKGRKGMGGYDVYKSERKLDGTWDEPQNMGYPINTAADELFYRPTQDSMVALYSTIRSDSYGGLDIYKIQKDSRIPYKLIGTVSDIETAKTLGATVNVYDKQTQKLIKSATVDTLAGIYMISFDDVGNYFMQVDYEGYKSSTEKVNLPEVKYATVVQDFKIEALKHPFTLVGRITDVDKETPLNARLTFKLAAYPDSVIGRALAAESTGKYSITFEDKYNMIIQVDAEDYFSVDEPLSAENEPNSVISKNIELKRSKIEYILTGRITDGETSTGVKAALSFYHPGEEEPFTIIISDSTEGKFTAVIEDQGPFMIEVEANGYFFTNEIYQFPAGQTFTSKNFSLKKMETGVKFVMKSILFNSGKATLKAESYAEMDKLADLLLKNDKIRVEVSGHTDNVGSASINKKVSRTRALTVKNYLVSRGVEQDRIEYEGYGFEQPIAPNDTPEGREQNRRVEIKILD